VSTITTAAVARKNKAHEQRMAQTTADARDLAVDRSLAEEGAEGAPPIPSPEGYGHDSSLTPAEGTAT
jgi:hypothetical protein